jgi:hypothetical protein
MQQHRFGALIVYQDAIALRIPAASTIREAKQEQPFCTNTAPEISLNQP